MLNDYVSLSQPCTRSPMDQLRDDQPVIDALKKLGYRLGLLDGVRNGWLLIEANGKSRKIKIHKSGPESGSSGRHRYGIGHRDFDSVDDFVFWAKGEACLLIVPSPALKNIFEAEQYQIKI